MRQLGDLLGIGGIEEKDAVGHGGEVVDQIGRQGEGGLDRLGLDSPGGVGEHDPAVDDWARPRNAAELRLEARALAGGLIEEATERFDQGRLFLCQVMPVHEDGEGACLHPD